MMSRRVSGGSPMSESSGLNIRSTNSSLLHTSTFCPFSAVSTPIFVRKYSENLRSKSYLETNYFGTTPHFYSAWIPSLAQVLADVRRQPDLPRDDDREPERGGVKE